MKVLAIFLLAALVSTAAAQDGPQAVFDMDASGNAKMTITEAMSLDVDEANIMASADVSNVLSFSGTLSSSDFALSPDYNARMSMQGAATTVSFEMSKAGVQELLDQLGDFDITVSFGDSGGTLAITIGGTMSKAMFEEGFLLDVALVQADQEGMRADLESLLNEVFVALNTSFAPHAVVGEFKLTGQDELTLTLKMRIENWGQFMASLVAVSSQQSGLMSCLNMDANGLMAAMASGGLTADARFSGSGDSITGSMEASSPAADSSAYLQSLSLEVSKTDSTETLQGSVGLSDAQTFITCLMKGTLPGDYVAEGFDYTLAKSPGSGGMQSLESRITGLAQKSGSNYVVNFPATMTSGMEITVNAPAGMGILSVSGGTQSGKSAVSTSGEEFSVTYGKAGGMDMIWIAAIVILVVIVLLLKSRRGQPKNKR